MGNSFAYGTEQQFAAAYPFLQQPAAAAAPAAATEDAGTAAAAATAAEPAVDSAAAAADRQLLLRFALALMLYHPTSVRAPSNPLAAAHAAAAAAAEGGGSSGGPQPMDVDTSSAAAAAAAALAGVPPGMSKQDVAAVEGKSPPAGDSCPLLPLAVLLQGAGVCSVRTAPLHSCRCSSCWLLALVSRSCHSSRSPMRPPPMVPQARYCCARSWAGSTSRQLPAWTPQRYCRPTWRPHVTHLTRCVGAWVRGCVGAWGRGGVGGWVGGLDVC